MYVGPRGGVFALCTARCCVQARQPPRPRIAEIVDDAVVQPAVARAGIQRQIGNVERAQHRRDAVAAPVLARLGDRCRHIAQHVAHSPLIPASLISLPHLALSSRMNRANSAGELVTSSMPCTPSRVLRSAPLRMRLTSALTRLTISGGVFAGMKSP